MVCLKCGVGCMSVSKEADKLPFDVVIDILNNTNFSKCSSCGHRTEKVFDPNGVLQCCISCLTMCNDKNECIWYERGNPFSKKINLGLAKSRMGKGGRIYFSRGEWVDV